MHVLIVDDQQSARTMLRHVVEDIGPDLTVEDFADPVAALRRSEQCEPDLLLLDYRMPEMDGLEFARRFRRVPANRGVPIVLISVVGDEPIRQAALDAGVIDVLVKPIRPRELRSRLKNLLALRQQGQSFRGRVQALEHQVLASMHEAEQRERDTLQLLARALEYRLAGSGTRLLRLPRLVGLVAETLGLADDEVWTLECAAPLYDIGKLGIRDAVLFKPGPLDAQELEVARSHALLGYDILSAAGSRFARVAAELALRHHERYDGSGYPDGLRGDEIPIGARIVGMVDVFDAMISDRPYRPAGPVDAAFEFLGAHAGTLFDPACVAAFLSQSARALEIVHAFPRQRANA